MDGKGLNKGDSSKVIFPPTLSLADKSPGNEVGFGAAFFSRIYSCFKILSSLELSSDGLKALRDNVQRLFSAH